MSRRDPLALKLKNEYVPLQGKYQSFSELISGIVGRLSKKVGKKYQMVSGRAKEPEKVYEKILRKRKEGKKYTQLSDIEDLAGARIIFYLESDRQSFIKDLHDELGEKSILSTQEQIKANGYRATHAILKLDEARTVLPEYADFKDLKCELQITSALYHAWSEVEHDIAYKPDGNREQLVELGLDRLEGKFKELHKHIQGAAIQLDLINEDYIQIKRFGNLLNTNLLQEIENSSNDKLIEILGLLEGFAHKKPLETYAAIEAVFSKKPAEPVVLGQMGTKEIKGKDHTDVELEAAKVFSRVRYYKPEETLRLVAKLMQEKEGTVLQEIRKVLEKFACYDYHYIQHQKNYLPQKLSLDYISNWSTKEKLQNFDFVETVTREVLKSEVEGTEWTSHDTLTMHSGSVPASDYLQTLRRTAIDSLSEIFHSTRNIKIKLKILQILQEATRSPHNSIDEKIKKIIEEDTKYLLGIYEKMIFSSDGKRLTGRLSIVEELESNLYWLLRWNIGGVDAINLRTRILKNRFYELARILVGNSRTFSVEEGGDGQPRDRITSIEELVSDVTRTTLDRWISDLNKIAAEREYIEEWQYHTFQDFLRRLSTQKSLIANLILTRVLAHNEPLVFFSASFLEGFRLAGRINFSDKFTRIAIRNKDVRLTRAVILGFYTSDSQKPETKIQQHELTVLENIVHRRNGFDFLNSADENFQLLLLGVLCHVISVSPRRIEALIRHQLKINKKLYPWFINSLATAIHRKTIDIQKLSKATKNSLKEVLIGVGNLEWRSQEVLLELGRDNLQFILDIFVSRIRFEESQKKDDLDFSKRYDAVPYQMNQDLAEFISNHNDLPRLALVLLSKMTSKWSLYNWDITHLFERIGSPGFGAIVELATSRGGQKNLLIAARCLSTRAGADIGVCMKVIQQTDNKRIIGLIDQAILSTSVVSGEYGLAEAYQRKADELKPFMRKRNRRIKNYATATVKSLETMASREKSDADREVEERKLRFQLQSE